MAPSPVSSTQAEQGSVTALGSKSGDAVINDAQGAGKKDGQKDGTCPATIVGSEDGLVTLAGLPTSSTSMLTRWLYETRPAQVTFTDRLQQGKE
ncbi:hypothetical protein NKR19_g9927 [Coniochaeta hoffmannii]|uniref:Uncharacterized protein n=1 Tax=Coniochaeta hoffmannii TaxID=91930 RepID=A0AA38R9S9_9PEZI|nr:hypothetical protein NKR19_g9927 [Coniochaeta hoffmannii]